MNRANRRALTLFSLKTAVVFTIFAAFQLFVLPLILPCKRAPNLFIILCSGLSLIHSQKAGMIVGFLSGFISDIFGSGYDGTQMLLYTLIGFLSGKLKDIFCEDALVRVLFIGLSDFIYGLMMFCVRFIPMGQFPLTVMLISKIIPDALFTMAAALCLHYPLKKFLGCKKGSEPTIA